MVRLVLSCANCRRLLTADLASLGSMFAYSSFSIEIFKENTQLLLSEIDGISINMIMHFYDSTKSVDKYNLSSRINPCGCGNTSGDIVELVSVNSTLENALGPEL